MIGWSRAALNGPEEQVNVLPKNFLGVGERLNDRFAHYERHCAGWELRMLPINA